jgi:hypothetical protein
MLKGVGFMPVAEFEIAVLVDRSSELPKLPPDAGKDIVAVVAELATAEDPCPKAPFPLRLFHAKMTFGPTVALPRSTELCM